MPARHRAPRATWPAPRRSAVCRHAVARVLAAAALGAVAAAQLISLTVGGA